VAVPAAVYYHLGMRSPGTNVELLVARAGAAFRTFVVLPPLDPGLAGTETVPSGDAVGYLVVRLAEQQAQIDALQTQVSTLHQQLQELSGGRNNAAR
jgi:hypothetical protein